MPDNWIVDTEIDKGYAFRYCDCCRRLIRNTVVMRNKDNGDCLVVGKECVRRLETDLLPKAKTDQAVLKRKERERNFLKKKWEKNEKNCDPLHFILYIRKAQKSKHSRVLFFTSQFG